MAAMPEAFPNSDCDAADRHAADAVQQAAQTLIGMIRVAQALVDCRRVVDLTGLDAAVGVLCAQLLDLAPQDARALRPTLIALDADIGRLADAMQREAAP